MFEVYQCLSAYSTTTSTNWTFKPADVLLRPVCYKVASWCVVMAGDGEKKLSKSRSDRDKDKDKEKEKEKEPMYTSDRALLLACVYFDQSHTGYLLDRDVEDVLHTTGLQLSRAQVTS